MSDSFVYLRDGTKCRVVSPDDGSGMVVYTQVYTIGLYGCGGSENVVDGELLLVQPTEVFDNPPVKVIDEQIKLKRLELDRLESDLLAKELQAARVKFDYETAMAKYASYSSMLSRLDDFVNGRITHFLLFDDYGLPYIAAIEELLSSNHNAKWGKALPLTATKWPDLTWTLGKVHISEECIPCASYVEAQKAGQRWVDDQISACVYRRHVILFATKYDLLVPADYIRAVKEREWKELLNAG